MYEWKKPPLNRIYQRAKINKNDMQNEERYTNTI